jgi:hypothetical protein
MRAARFQHHRDVVYRPEGLEGAILFDPDRSRVQVVNLTGAFIWERLDGEASLDSLCEALRAQFDEAPPMEALRAEIEGFVRMLVSEGLAAQVVEGP